MYNYASDETRSDFGFFITFYYISIKLIVYTRLPCAFLTGRLDRLNGRFGNDEVIF